MNVILTRNQTHSFVKFKLLLGVAKLLCLLEQILIYMLPWKGCGRNSGCCTCVIRSSAWHNLFLRNISRGSAY
ncbi:hypothetical protein L596_012656 [Steinernema carpocapsae]|uniref:Uncharacterized protein n=1 Tax=Steinernema carpocapsae TaxID=34508 RepID=A0A4U5NYL2_STECR|nr:hypothetical protein L596_012656 [Steinernema carpocapsae]